ncbi:MAG: hypothetical protein CML24_11405 [Rhizobiales bacterium]|nr:hypothetical protein [Hyphomicrobiales bacterium]
MARENFASALTEVLAHEGGYVNNPADPGGPTNLGVTLGTAKRLGIDVDGDGDTDIIDIKLLQPVDAAKVYRAEYWNKVRGDDLPSGLDFAVFDFAVNSGPGRAAKYLQALVGVAQDGSIGPKTLAAVAAYDPAKLIDRLCDRRMTFLRNLSHWSTFGKGWTRRVEGVRAVAKQMAAQAPEMPTQPQKPVPSPQAPETGKPHSPIKSGGLVAILVGAAALVAFFIFGR